MILQIFCFRRPAQGGERLREGCRRVPVHCLERPRRRLQGHPVHHSQCDAHRRPTCQQERPGGHGRPVRLPGRGRLQPQPEGAVEVQRPAAGPFGRQPATPQVAGGRRQHAAHPGRGRGRPGPLHLRRLDGARQRGGLRHAPPPRRPADAQDQQGHLQWRARLGGVDAAPFSGRGPAHTLLRHSDQPLL